MSRVKMVLEADQKCCMCDRTMKKGESATTITFIPASRDEDVPQKGCVCEKCLAAMDIVAEQHRRLFNQTDRADEGETMVSKFMKDAGEILGIWMNYLGKKNNVYKDMNITDTVQSLISFKSYLDFTRTHQYA